MKSFVVTLLIIAAGFCAYDFFLAPPNERLVFPRPPEGDVAAANWQNSSAPARGSADSKAPPSGTAPASSSLKPPPAGEPLKSQETARTESTLVFREPKLDSIEALTEGWKKLPKTAFPRPVKLLKDTTFNLSVGASKFPAGSQAVALGLDDGMVLVAPSETSGAHKPLPLDDTDLKSRLIAIYEQWKTDRVTEARKQFEERKRRPKPASTTATVDESGKPVRSGDGTYPLLMAQLHAGVPSEITPMNIIRWGSAELQSIKGNPTWVIPVTYNAKTMFGVMEVDTLAYVQKGRVVDWIYKGSREPVP